MEIDMISVLQLSITMKRILVLLFVLKWTALRRSHIFLVHGHPQNARSMTSQTFLTPIPTLTLTLLTPILLDRHLARSIPVVNRATTLAKVSCLL